MAIYPLVKEGVSLQQQVEKQRRAITCYQCGVSLGLIEVSIDVDGMTAFREEARRRRKEHVCGQGEAPRLPEAAAKPSIEDALRPPSW